MTDKEKLAKIAAKFRADMEKLGVGVSIKAGDGPWVKVTDPPKKDGAIRVEHIQCPRCFGKGLENQDDRPGLLLGPLGEMECSQCHGKGTVPSGETS